MTLIRALAALLCCCLSSAQMLDPGGKNVCKDVRVPSTHVCCTGWRQHGKECTIPVCEGEQACLKNEICLFPGVCRCPAGFYGAQCKTRCPGEFWSSDCRQACHCFPHGRCHPETGECTCNPSRWGSLCQNACKCTRNGYCHPVDGNCTCDAGWWTSTCFKPCQCLSEGSVGPSCDQLTGQCHCRSGFWGMKCPFRCSCNQSPCDQWTGECKCEAGSWGPSCDRKCNCDLTHSSCDPSTGQCLCHPGYQGLSCSQPCGPGRYGSGCKMSCGYCQDKKSCSATDGTCDACEAGWNGTRCDHSCPPGLHGYGCKERCPRCRNNEPCDKRTGNCRKCDAGWTGARCEKICPDRTYGDSCSFLCRLCVHGNCHHVTGRCVCQPGFQGESCNSSCSASKFGLNCSSVCECGEGVHCHPTTGACPNSGRSAVLAGVLVPLFLLLLAVLCCCLCCGGGPAVGKDSVAVADGGWLVRMKYHVYSVLANIGAALPCASNWSSGLPRVTVSHHDPELTFNHSFIEPPSSNWVTEGSSFESDEEEGEALYCVPPREDIPAVAGGEFQEMSSKCNMFLDPSGFSTEDIASTFNIPRTSSIAKSKRPSVSFAEGTRFSPKERRGSGQDPGGLPRSKAKSPWGALMLSTLQGSPPQTGEEDEAEDEVREGGVEVQLSNNQESSCEAVDLEVDRTPPRASLQVPGPSGRRRTMSNTVAQKGSQLPTSVVEDGSSQKVTTVYVTLAKAGKILTKTESGSEGRVQAMLRRLGSLQRHREQESGKPKSKVVEGITKPPRRKLGARVTLWEQRGPPAGGAGIVKPARGKQSSQDSADPPGTDPSPPAGGGTPPSVLKVVAEVAQADSGSDSRTEEESEQGGTQTESSYQTVGPAGDAAEVISAFHVDYEPCYENVFIKQS
ncbi:Scavenger receptor class F member 1 [Oryzias melastigma]|uniref:Scavenger receptor class F member 1 n=1 Tax=Oryzias melastigma TaxID=30732 RepID=A0A834FLK4_ORYME|nr:Scavenger receptor class F member 1 [Oryzias melastigma]